MQNLEPGMQTTLRGRTAQGRFANLLDRIKRGDKLVRVGGAAPPVKAFLIAHLAAALHHPILVLCHSIREAETLWEDISFFLTLPEGENNPEVALPRRPHYFPPWEILPWEPISPPPDISGQRLAVLWELLGGRVDVLVTTPGAMLQRILPPAALRRSARPLKLRESIRREELTDFFATGGYHRFDLVEKQGDYSVRGHIVDFFPSHREAPVRVEFFGDVVESIREFDVETQRSSHHLEAVELLPMREVLIEHERLPAILARVRESAGAQGLREGEIERLVDLLSTMRYFPGVEILGPLVWPQMALLVEYLAPNAIVVVDEADQVEARAQSFRNQVREEHSRARTEARFAPPVEAMYSVLGPFPWEGWFPTVEMSTLALSPSESLEEAPSVWGGMSFPAGPKGFSERILAWLRQNYAVVLTAPNTPQAARLQRVLSEHDLGADVRHGYPLLQRGFLPRQPAKAGDVLAPLSLCIGKLSSGFNIPDLRLAFMTEGELFGVKKRPRRPRRTKRRSLFYDFHDLEPGDYVVHVDYGIGRYLGANLLAGEGFRGELLQVEYAEGEKLYVPVDRLDLVQKYVGGGDEVPRIDRLGGSSWRRVKRHVKESLREMAQELLELYAARQITEGYAFGPDTEIHREFYAAFEYEETEDQLLAIEEVLADMEQEKPMDRLVCGDVGYGKTEVAMRAAFKAVMDFKQVAVLVPTTILAQQHLNTFKERFAPYPVCIEVLSRFKRASEQQDILNRLREGKADVIIGTHRLLQPDVEFSDLSLVIIDEEQRFGVAHKERLKQLRRTVEVMTLTATPIPRTLHLSLSGIRDLSVIDTPPEDRLAIRTYLTTFSPQVIREAILREVERGGQVYFVHNRVETIDAMARLLRRVVPEVKLGIAHGQLPERVLERRMLQFLGGEFQILLCTSIIESGLDIPSVNTIIINRADTFGLAQLYQLRGRVGRYKHRAYAYLLVPAEEAISELAKKRLQAVMELTELGSGFKLAYRDMEIRGVGNILGPQQSGHIAAIGFDMYCRLLEEVVRELKGASVPEEISPHIDLGLSAYLPKDYVEDTPVRLSLYRRIVLGAAVDEIDDLSLELRDRFGRLPEPTEALLALARLRVLAKQLRIVRIDAADGASLLTFDPSTPVTVPGLLDLIKEDGGLKLVSQNTLRLENPSRPWREKVAHVEKQLRSLLECATVSP